jgi:ElaB/YqjD/DUF883 family membrane-anchored ribosome-binding protein
MGDQDIPIHEIRDARTRMSELADELARRAEPERLKAYASGKAAELKAQARERVTEKKDELKMRATEAVMRRTTDMKERADTPMGWSMLGAIIGAGVGSVLMKKAFNKRMEASYTPTYADSPALVPAPEGGLMRPSPEPSKTEELKSRASETFESVKEKVQEKTDQLRGSSSEMMDQARGMAGQVRERISSYRGDSGYHQESIADRFSRTVEDQPLLLAVGGIALGMIVAGLIPETRRERQFISPTKRKMTDKVKSSVSEVGHKLEQKLEDMTEEEEEHRASASESSETERGKVPPLPPLDEYKQIH